MTLALTADRAPFQLALLVNYAEKQVFPVLPVTLMCSVIGFSSDQGPMLAP